MPSVFVVVSKAVYEKQARAAGRLLGPGDVWPTRRYDSEHPSLEPLAAGGAMFLVTARAGDALWLVAILESPKKVDGGWQAAPNVVPVTDVTALIPKLEFANKKGLHAPPGKLGMSLQTPRAPSPADEALLRAAAGAAPIASASTAPGRATDIAAPAVTAGATRLTLASCVRPKADLAALAPSGRAQVKFVVDREEGASLAEARENEESIVHSIELVTFADAATNAPAFDLVLYAFGDGALFDAGTTKVRGAVVQHGFELEEADPELHRALEAAWSEGRARVGAKETIAFGEPKPAAPKDDANDPLAAAIARARAEKAAGKEHELARFWKLAYAALGEYGPVPMKRADAITRPQRDVLELLFDLGNPAQYLQSYGYPDNAAHDGGSQLARFLGRVAPGPFEATVELDGARHPLVCLLCDAAYGLRAHDAVLDAILRDAGVDVGEAVLRALLTSQEPYHLRAYRPVTLAEAKVSDRPSKGVPPEQAMRQRYVELLVAFARRLGERGRAVVAEVKAREASKGARLDPFAATVALAFAAADGPLPPEDDALLGAVIKDGRSLSDRRVVFALVSSLPDARAAALFALHPAYVDLAKLSPKQRDKSIAWVVR